MSFIYLFYLFLSVLDCCNLVDSHLKSTEINDINFYNNHYRPIETGKPNPPKINIWCSALYFVS